MKNISENEGDGQPDGVEFGWRPALVRAGATVLIAIGLLALIRFVFM